MWWSRFAQPDAHAWQAVAAPMRLVEQERPKDAVDPKALACYGLLIRPSALVRDNQGCDQMLPRKHFGDEVHEREQEGAMRQPLKIRVPTVQELEALAQLYHTTRDARLRARVHIVLLAAEQRLTAPAISVTVREDNQTLHTWLKHWLAEGIVGLYDRPMPGAPPKITEMYDVQLLEIVRRRSRCLEQPNSMWTL